MKGSRVQGIVRELSGERIDIVPYSEDPIAFVTKALSPAKILQTVPDEENRRMKVIVTEDQLSLAIGKSGQNARLAAKLTGWEIDLVSEEEFAAARGEKPRRLTVPVDRLEGLGPKTVENLIQSGFETVEDIVKATMEELMNVPGIGDVTAQKLYLSAVQHLEHLEAEKAREAEASLAAASLEAVLAPVGRPRSRSRPQKSLSRRACRTPLPSRCRANRLPLGGSSRACAANVELLKTILRTSRPWSPSSRRAGPKDPASPKAARSRAKTKARAPERRRHEAQGAAPELGGSGLQSH
jgi:hypothetical protein